MRRPPLTVLAFLIALAGCNPPTGADNRAAAPEDDAPVPTTPAAAGNEAAGLADFRARWLEACVGGARDAAPPGTPVERHCGCAIDRIMVGRTLDELEADRESGAYRSRFQSEMRSCIRAIPS